MQIFLKLPSARTVVAQCQEGDSVRLLAEKVFESEGIPDQELRFAYGGKQLDDDLDISSVMPDCATVNVLLRMRGGAARKKKEAAEAAHYEAMVQEYASWHAISDQTENTGVMRLLCVSLVLQKNKDVIHGAEDSPETPFRSDPCSEDYEAPWGDGFDRSSGSKENFWTGYPSQEDFNTAFDKVKDEFLDMWSHFEPLDGQDENGPPTLFYDKNRGIYVTVELGEWDAIWWNGPKKIFETDNPSNVVWDYADACGAENLFYTAPKGSKELTELTGLSYPWRIGGEFAEIERWFYQGIGSTTYYTPTAFRPPPAKGGEKGAAGAGKVAVAQPKKGGGWIQWSQRDLHGILGLTDREKLRLRQMFQITKKLQSPGKKSQLDPDEKDLVDGPLKALVEEGPMHSPQHGIFQWQIKSLKKQLANKCVFWSNTEDHLPNGSVADGTRTAEDDDAKDGQGIELIEFWKYEKKIGSLRKKYILEDRQRLMDTIEAFTPTYKAVIKNRGQDADDDDGDHYMTDENQRMITNIVALAMDTHMPDYPEDKIACMVKTLIEQRIGPTWHVLVGRSMGYAVQCEARHFLHMFMQHLAFIIWKSEPDPNSGPKQTVQG